MGKILLYGSFTIFIALALWFYSRGSALPGALKPVLLLLLAVMSYGYGIKAKEDGDIGAGNGKIRRDTHPRIFRAALYFNYLLTGVFAVLAIYYFFG